MDGEMGPHWCVERESELDMRLLFFRALSGASLYLELHCTFRWMARLTLTDLGECKYCIDSTSRARPLHGRLLRQKLTNVMSAPLLSSRCHCGELFPSSPYVDEYKEGIIFPIYPD